MTPQHLILECAIPHGGIPKLFSLFCVTNILIKLTSVTLFVLPIAQVQSNQYGLLCAAGITSTQFILYSQYPNTGRAHSTLHQHHEHRHRQPPACFVWAVSHAKAPTLCTCCSSPGGSMKSKCTKSSMPSFFSCSTTEPRLERRISGYVFSCISVVYAFSVYRRKHLPGRVRPARPARCWALALEMAVTRRDSTRMRGLYTCVTMKESILLGKQDIVMTQGVIAQSMFATDQKSFFYEVCWVDHTKVRSSEQHRKFRHNTDLLLSETASDVSLITRTLELWLS